MSFDLVLMVVLVAGIALSAAYVRAEYISWREDGAAERRRESALSELHAARLSRDASAHSSVVQIRPHATSATRDSIKQSAAR
jgi:citrate lyase beta subunit